ncbi:ferritin-like domain-containing protein [Polyangium sp. 6x1]|uniref:ferritin-like domain-containing protein n=1 Tax=Polyangium sp. 6x1 TaxID=3042689 RepID=UPI0024831AC5|nr:ferritin-like domain-containing protein [Polyangium sp. 6x1]MDI1446052.1 ferritin-like domain-containing protein [Polyangium sp. 6x1]
MPSPSPKRAPRAAASEAVRAEWLRRVHAEYRSAAITQHLTLWLIQLGVSPDLIHDGLRIVKDELAHARMSHATYRAAGGKEMPILAQETLGLRRNPSEPLHLGAARAGVEVFCLGETVAVPLFKVLREGCTAPQARRTLDRVLRDEVRHRDFGWSMLDHLLELPFADDVRRLVEAELPAMFGRLLRSYAPAFASGRDAITAEDRAWGLMPPARYGQIVERTLERDYAPRFAARGFDAVRAFESARNP